MRHLFTVVLRKRIIRLQAAISSSQYSWCSPPRISLARIRQAAGNSMPLSFRSPVLVSHEDRECLVPSWSVVFPDCSGNPLPQNRPKMLLAQGDHVVQALTPDVPISRSQ